jgi:hypothetical protein
VRVSLPMMTAHEVLAKAVVPQTRIRLRTVSTAAAKPNGSAAKVGRIPNAMVPHRLRRVPMETLIGWEQESIPTPKLLKFKGDPQFTYAAIPVPDGWLIVQL